MNSRITYLLAALIVGFAVFAIMHWVFRFDNTESVMFGLIAATAETAAYYVIRIFTGRKKDSSV